jgi:hypothetical protein
MTKTTMSIRVLRINDTLNLANLILIYLIQEFNFDPTQWVGFFFLCPDAGEFLSYALAPSTSWLMVLISIDRFFNIALPRRFLILKRKSFELKRKNQLN